MQKQPSEDNFVLVAQLGRKELTSHMPAATLIIISTPLATICMF